MARGMGWRASLRGGKGTCLLCKPSRAPLTSLPRRRVEIILLVFKHAPVANAAHSLVIVLKALGNLIRHRDGIEPLLALLRASISCGAGRARRRRARE